ncbi:hypothetical protein PPYC2_21730 [Paenibacillus polymyxa]|uniref:hypothetical protein n=1 Tax=Paenibacillus polymyxa TaxID=1406 RepID=UPI0008FB20CA|nr:hypothetical protein [Paenibacillus polymyxa]APB77406.1 hypothetical protein PPYC2_21730 [Paenibacillus polymyxa]
MFEYLKKNPSPLWELEQKEKFEQALKENNLDMRNPRNNHLLMLAQEKAELERMRKEIEVSRTPRPLDEWGEDYGDVLWWKFPIVEPPYCGTPLDADWPDYHTHWTPITIPVTTERYFKCHECLEYSNAAEWNEKTENTLGRSIIHIEAKWLGMEYICPKCGAEQDGDDITEWENTP